MKQEKKNCAFLNKLSNDWRVLSINELNQIKGGHNDDGDEDSEITPEMVALAIERSKKGSGSKSGDGAGGGGGSSW